MVLKQRKSERNTVWTQFSRCARRMSDIVDILGIDKEVESPKETKKGKKESKKESYAKLPRYLRDLVDDDNPLPKSLLEEKKSRVKRMLLSF